MQAPSAELLMNGSSFYIEISLTPCAGCRAASPVSLAICASPSITLSARVPREQKMSPCHSCVPHLSLSITYHTLFRRDDHFHSLNKVRLRFMKQDHLTKVRSIWYTVTSMSKSHICSRDLKIIFGF